MMNAASSYFCFNCEDRTTVNELDLTCGRCGGGFVQAVNESDIPSLAEETLPVLMDPRIPQRTAQATVSPSTEEDDTYLNSLAPLRDALNDFARTLGSHGLPPVLNDRHASHSANRHALSLGFRLVREPTPTRQSTPMLRNLSSVVEEMNNDTEVMPPLTDSDDDDDMPGLEPNEEQPNDLRSLFQPVRVHFQVNAPTPGQPHINMDPQFLRMVMREHDERTNRNLTQQFFTHAASSFERVNNVLVDLVSNMLRQEQGTPPITEEQLQNIPVHPVDPSMLGENPACAVCLEPFAVDQSYKNITCQHRFHPYCLDRWLLTHGNCPVCRTPYCTDTSATTEVAVDTAVIDSSITSTMDSLD